MSDGSKNVLYPAHVRVEVSSDDSSETATITAISTSRCRITGIKCPEIESEIKLHFSFFEISTPVTLLAGVCESEGREFICEFRNLDAFVKNVLRMCVMRLKKAAREGNTT